MLIRYGIACALIVGSVGANLTYGETRGHISLEYQYIKVDGFKATTGTLDIGTTNTHSMNLEVEYALTERWSISAGLPWIRKRYRGPGPHDPTSIVPPADSAFIDDGDYHSDFQDVHLGLRFTALRTPRWSIAPFVYYGVPSNDYTFFGHSAVGQNLRRAGVGTTIGFYPALADYYLLLSPAYEFVEKTLGTNINHWRIHAEAGYFLNARVSARTFLLVKEGKGRDFPDDFPPPRNDEWWYQHDRMVRHNYVNAGVGVDWQATARNRLSVSVMTMVHADQVHIMDYAITLGLSRGF